MGKSIKIIWKEESNKGDSLGLVGKQGKQTQKIKVTADKKVGVKAVKPQEKSCPKPKGEGLFGKGCLATKKEKSTVKPECKTKFAVKEARQELSRRFGKLNETSGYKLEDQYSNEKQEQKEVEKSFLSKLNVLIDQVSATKRTEAFEQVKKIINEVKRSKKMKLNEANVGETFEYKDVKYIRIGKNLASIAKNNKLEGSVNIPSGVKDGDEALKVVSVVDEAFANCRNITLILLPSTVTKIGTGAFKGCSSLTDVQLPSGLIKIEENTFADCSSLKSIDIPSSVKTIGMDAFRSCKSMTSVSLPESLETIEEAAFGNCQSLEKITFPKSLKYIESYAFQRCYALTSVNIPDSVVKVDEGAFLDCKNLSRVKQPKSCKFGDDVFKGTKYKENKKEDKKELAGVSESKAYCSPRMRIINESRKTK